MGKPNWGYNPRSNRWEVRGKGGDLRFTIPDTNTPLGQILHIVGSSGAIAMNATYGRLIGTITGMSQLLRGDVVMATPRITVPTYGIAGFAVPSNTLLNFYAQDTTGVATGTIPALSWDVLVVRKV